MNRLAIITSLTGLLLSASLLTAQEKVSFEKEIVSLIAKRCVECHNARDVKGGLDLSSRKTAFQGGDSGQVITAGKVADSPLLERLVAGEMPPKSRGQSQKLPAH
ncbi:MAG: c-type cytochrome domain-containing protein [Pirellulaceae bacterium]